MPFPPPLYFSNATAILPDRLIEDAALLAEGGRIKAVDARAALPCPAGAERIDAGGGYLGPGYLDIHVHGGAGADFMDGTAEAVRAAVGCHTRHGTTTIFPTTTTGSREQIRAMLEACREVRDGWAPAQGARIAGVHFYGPYFAAPKVGCHNPAGRRDPDSAEYRAAFETGLVKVATCAAELPGVEDFCREARKRGCLVTCGHSDASWTEMKRAFDAGMRHVDHFWCAMSSVPSLRERFGTPMQGSMEQFVLRHEEMSTEVIADGIHLAPELLEYAHFMKGPQRLLLVTDANRAVDMPPGRYRFGPASDGEWFESDGKVGFQPGHGLASGVVGMDAMVARMHRLAGVSLPDAARMGSLTPAERTGIAGEVGSLEAGKRADVLMLDRELAVRRVFVEGVEVPGV
ncbi:MAG: amidohydrolase family protein [Planctomycetota bacterium]|nr:amidohydrolase family protein [Planctomycetota bacterium]